MGHVYVEVSTKVSLSRVFSALVLSFLLRRILPTFGKVSLSDKRINCPPVEQIIDCVDKD